MTSSASAPVVLVLTTIGADADAPALARTLVDERLAACVNILPPMTSIYRWKGNVEEDREQLLVIKTAATRAQSLMDRIRQLHPYEVPELLVVPASDGSAAYLDWVVESVS